MEKVKCLKCGSTGYTASPDRTRCYECNGPLRVADSQKNLRINKLRVKKCRFSALTLRKTYGILFLHKLTFCSLNRLGTRGFKGFLITHGKCLMMYKSRIYSRLKIEASYLLYIDRGLLVFAGGAS